MNGSVRKRLRARGLQATIVKPKENPGRSLTVIFQWMLSMKERRPGYSFGRLAVVRGALRRLCSIPVEQGVEGEGRTWHQGAGFPLHAPVATPQGLP